MVFAFGLTPINFSFAITQNQINAEVQIVCPDNYENWFSGSGTIIDPKGIILTNRHVIEGAYKNACFIGFIKSISQEPDFGTEGNYNLAEVKYYTTTSDMDAAILYLDNQTNKSYPYVNIWNSNSDTLQFGDKIEAIGFPSIGGSTVTYTSGDFSGFGSKPDGTQNYIKTTTQLEHGNSGGASYNSKGQFVGIPTMVVAGTLNSLSYILSVNSIKSWLSGVLGKSYQQEVIEQKPVIETPKVSIQDDITPPSLINTPSDLLWVEILDDNSYDGNYNIISTQPVNNYTIKLGYKNRKLRFRFKSSFDARKIDSESGFFKTIYSYSTKLEPLEYLNKSLYITSYDKFEHLTGIVVLPYESDKFYFSFQFVDNAGNISERKIATIQFENGDNDNNNIAEDKNIDLNFSNKLKGKILLQVENHGEAYYIYPKNSKRYYMANGDEAYRIMRYLGVGITNKDLGKVKSDKNFAKKHSGKIFLQVEAKGEAYYIDFNGNAHYLKDGNAAYTIMKNLGLGITNNDLNKIPEGNL